MKNNKKWLAYVLSVVMVLAYMPAMAFAAVKTADNVDKIEGIKVASDGTVTWSKAMTKSGMSADKYELRLLVRDINGSNYARVNNLTPKAAKDSGVYKLELTADGTVIVTPVKDKENDFLNLSELSVNLKKEFSLDKEEALKGKEITVDVVGFKKKDGSNDYDQITYYGTYTKPALVSGDYGSTATNVAQENFFTISKTADAAKNKLGIVTEVSFPDNGKVTWKAPAGDSTVAPTSYVVTLYRNEVALADNANAIPKGAEKIETYTVSGTEVNVYDKLIYVAPTKGAVAKNFFFVTIVAQRPEGNGIVTSPMVSKRKDNELTNVIAAFTPQLTNNGVAKIDREFDKVTFQLYKRNNSGAFIPVGEPVVKAPYKANDEVSFASSITDLGFSYSVGAVAEMKSGAKSGVSYSNSIVYDFKTVAPTVAWKSGADIKTPVLVIKPGKVTDVKTQKAATAFKTEVAYKGVSLKTEGVNAVKVENSDDYTMDLTAVVAQVTDEGKKLEDFTVTVWGENADALDSNKVTLAKDVAAPKQAYWDLTNTVEAVAKWSEVAGAEAYVVKLYEAGVADAVKELTVKSNQAELTQYMKNDKAYSFKVAAKLGNVTSAFVDSLVPTRTVNARLATVTDVKWDETNATWTPVQDAVKYSVQVYKNGVAYGLPIEVVGTKVDLSKYMLAYGGYQFTVRAMSAKANVFNGNPSEMSEMKNLGGKIVKLGNTAFYGKYAQGKYSVRVYFNKAANANRYNVYLFKNGKYRYVKTVKTNNAFIGGLKKGSKYFVKVRPYYVSDGLLKKGKLSTYKKVYTKK